MLPSKKTINVAGPRVEKNGGTSRVVADVDGVPLWFESEHLDLRPSPEAFVSALLFLSVHLGRTIVSEETISDLWLSNAEAIQRVWQEWWGYLPRLPNVQTHADSGGDNQIAALMFSAGVDSYHSLLGGSDPDMLVAVHGFDIPLSDERRMDGLRGALYATAEAHGKQPVIVRTNLREHPSIGKPRLWERSHGGALAAVGHLMSNQIGRVIISASWFTSDEQPWGSHSRTDRFFSGSGLTVEHFGNDIRREEKAAIVALDKTAIKHLRVCYKNVMTYANCSRCEKCVVTMLHLMENGVLDDFELFDGTGLAAKVEALPFIHHWYNVSRRILQRGKIEPDVARALVTVLNRSRRAHSFLRAKSRIQQVVDRYV